MESLTVIRGLSSPRSIIFMGFVVVIILILDLSAGDTWSVRSTQMPSEQLLFYAILIIITIVIQIFILAFASLTVFRTKKSKSRLASSIAYLYVASNIMILILLSCLLGEQLIFSQYHIIFSKSIIGASLTVSTLTMLSLAFTCIKSYISTKSKIAGIYGFAMIAISLQMVAAFLYVETSLNNKPDIITPLRDPWTSYYFTILLGNLLYFYEIVTIISFASVWISAVLLTKSYIKKIGKLKYFIILSIPVVYFSLQYSPILLSVTGSLSYLLMANGSLFPYLYNFVLNTAHVGAGVLFGISFFIISKSFSNASLKFYLIMCGAGLMIIFSSSVSTSLIASPYPAWSIASISFALPASFLITLGLDYASYRVAGDVEIRKYLAKLKNEFDLLSALGSTEASASIERKVQNVSNQIYNSLETETLFAAPPSSDDIKKYVKDVMVELKRPTQ